MRIHILGASGSGTTTLGAALAERSGARHLDTDDYFWLPTDPPFEVVRPSAERVALLEADLDTSRSWVLSGSLCGWGDPLVGRFDLTVFLFVPTSVRLVRLRDRERQEFGAEALAPGGRMHANHVAFLEWAAGYDHGDLDTRSLARHEAWLAELSCPTLRLDGESPVDVQVSETLRLLEEANGLK
jgi:adenylate kinase family enzyme